jgi:DNA-binding NtrC family response regulator
MDKHILIIDDEQDIARTIQDILHDEDYQTTTAANGAEAEKMREETHPDLILMDVWMPDIDGISLLSQWQESGKIKGVPVIMMSGHATIETAIEATRLGAYDFMEKPLSMAKLLITIEHALQSQLLKSENQQLKSKGSGLNAEAEDILELLRFYTDYYVQREKLAYRRFSTAAQNHLIQYPWPGSIKELKKIVKHLLLNGSGDISLDEAKAQTQASIEADHRAGGCGFNGLPLRQQYERSRANCRG